ncbi:nicotinate-nucleotide adenylyltransferase [Tannockella kyphosi]|uniref:nicotinate-nucleotide adenylyltransferase n=1 Tax=Tannockella kyphosi TaxID=2899121 RepID=UPI00201321B6|nr:nicotinate-nucleotide adenylyltransferase [Tannockella kyphosi]
MKIGILGGSFDPIHLGHIDLITYAKSALQLDRILLIPTGNNPWKEGSYATDEQRLTMLHIATRKDSDIIIETMELEDNETKNYTINTLEKLQNKYKDDTLYLIMGMDHVEKFHLWKKASKISELVNLVAFHRGGYQTYHENLDKYHFILLDKPALEISSSAIRNGDTNSLDKKVRSYIFNNGIYLDTVIASKMSKKRYEHSASMTNIAVKIAENNNVDTTKTYVAAMFHDIAKELDKTEAKKLMKKHYPEYLEKAPVLYHQWLGAYLAKKQYGIKDKEILEAICSHTTGSTTMSKLAKCIYVADKYDPYRGYDSSKEIALCISDIDAGFRQCLIDFYEYSKKENRPIDQSFYEIYKIYVTKGEENE